MEPRQPQKSPSPARNSSAFYLERELQGTQPSLRSLLRSRISEHGLNRTLGLHGLSSLNAASCRTRGPRPKHRFFFIPVLRSIRLVLCENRFQILLAQEPLAAAKATLFSSSPQVDLESVPSTGIFLAGGAVSGSPNPSAPRPGSAGLWGQQARCPG